ncbi:uncharacterized protein MONBRDRAFT_29634 [Monosiga brevicollis MX1]|uniref:AB hydrolase-1 domain-containing protein n=1 Tax=Monosiga brevicollis TaxID=81824 RepID=A9VBP2_MONBE|nr:uncharacterized protein MONBRDRAFT_29634 [Monosiga brevicollis MX1]EDQ84966.1 predicted protein [Monosiga brevicollis MX1]|eukprot:XP_001750136.1 hypothetical protein [Monosiga brevicollis MX1]
MTVERAQSVGLPHLLLIHGFAGGLALWNLSLEALSQRYQVHAIDAPGFADSSRIKFSKDPDAAEDEICETIEAWRAAQGIEQMVVAGHSFGGFIAGNYALRHPERVQRLVLLDPWGLPQKPDDHNFSKYPWWARLSISVLSKFPPLAVVRAAGPWGESLMGLRKDLGLRFREYLGNDRDFYGCWSLLTSTRASRRLLVLSFRRNTYLTWDSLTVTTGSFLDIYHCNAQSPSGELAFHHMSIPIGWAKNPLAPRLPLIDERIPINFMFGEQSWISPEPAVAFSATRPNSTVKFVPRAGHHLMWDNAPVFTETMLTLADEEARRHRVSVDSV